MLDRVPPPPLNSTSSLTVLNLTVESTSSFIGAVTMGAGATVASNLGVTGTVTITGVLTAQSSLAVSSATTLTGPVSLGGALSAVSGLSSLAGLNASATAVVSLTVSSAVTFSGLTKVLDQGDFIIQNQADTTKQLEFNLSGQTTGKLLTLSSLLTTSQVLQVPNITTTDTLPTLGLAQAFSAVNTFSNSQDATALGTGALVLSAGGLSVNNQIRLGGILTSTNTTSATTSLLGAVVIGNGTAATSVAFGGGKANIGGSLTVAGICTLDTGAAGSSFGGALTIAGIATINSTAVQQSTSTDPGGTVTALAAINNFNITANNGQVVQNRLTVQTNANAFNYTASLGLRANVGQIIHNGTGTVTGAPAFFATIANLSTGIISNAYNFYSSAMTNSGGGSITNASGFYSGTQTAGTNRYGYYCEAQSGGTLNYAFFSAGAGLVGISDTTSATTSLLGAVVIGNGTAATSVAFGGGKANIGGTLAVAGACTLDTGATGSSFGGTLTVGGASISLNSAATASVIINAATANTAQLTLQINGANTMKIQCTATYWGVLDSVNSWNPILYTIGAVGAGVVAFGGTLAATSSTAASVKFAGGVAINAGLWISSATMISTSTSFTNGAAAQIATLTNGPTAGNPTKWIPINDNGVTRYIPAW